MQGAKILFFKYDMKIDLIKNDYKQFKNLVEVILKITVE